MINSYYIIYYTVIIVKSFVLLLLLLFEKKNYAFINKNQPKLVTSTSLSCGETSFIHTTKLLTYLAYLARL